MDPADRLVRALRACGNRHRLRLLRSVLASPRPVRQRALVAFLGFPQFLAARYLQILVDSGLLLRERRGLAVRYRPARGASPEIRRLLRMVRALPLELFGLSKKKLERALK